MGQAYMRRNKENEPRMMLVFDDEDEALDILEQLEIKFSKIGIDYMEKDAKTLINNIILKMKEIPEDERNLREKMGGQFQSILRKEEIEVLVEVMVTTLVRNIVLTENEYNEIIEFPSLMIKEMESMLKSIDEIGLEGSE